MADDSPSSCIRCGAERDGHSYLILFGEWDSERDGFVRAPATRSLCRSCWHEHYGRPIGAHYEVRDVQRLWNILAASGGDLVADLGAMILGTRPFARVVDGELQVASLQARRVDAQTIGFEPEHHDLGEEWFVKLFADAADDRRRAILKPVEETPFGDVRERGGQSHKLTRYTLTE